eukprot:m.28561 g.28561  ORF g.28561 m.28561 type:complete len:1009 (-) comp10459_c0_seq1:65-3091(-)
MFSRGFGDDEDAGFGLGFSSRFGGLSGYDDIDDDTLDPSVTTVSAYGDADVIIEEAIFSKKRFNFKPPSGTTITQVVCGGGYAFIVLSNAKIIQRPITGSGNDVVFSAVPMKKAVQYKVEQVFVDPAGSHMIVCAVSSDGHECFYIHLRSGKLDPFYLNAIKRRKITAVAWNPLANPAAATTQPILLGDSQGCIFEMIIQHNDHRARQIFSLPDAAGGITGIHLDAHESAKTGLRFYIILACSHRFLQYMGPPGPEGARFENILKQHELTNGAQEAPPLPRSHLSIFQHYPSPAQAMAWMTPLGAYFGQFDFANALREENTAIPTFNVIPYNPATQQAGDEADVPLALVLTEFHVLLMYRQSMRALCTLNNKQVLEEKFPSRAGAMIGIVRDSKTDQVLCYSNAMIFAIDSSNETRDLWRLMMDKGKFDAALTYCTTDADRNEVHAAQANFLFDNQELEEAARAFAKTDVAFETVALKFLDKQEEGPLRIFLMEKLKRLKSDEITQCALLTTWLVELFLNSLDKLESAGKKAEYDAVINDFFTFLEFDACKKVLHRETVFDLISSHGNVQVLLFFARLHDQYDVVVQHHIHMGNLDNALQVLKDVGNQHPALIYHFAPELIQSKPVELIDICTSLDNVDPRELIPAFVRHQQHAGSSDAIHHIISYLKWCVEKQHSDDPAIHNYLITLYVTLDDEKPLMDFISQQLQGEPSFDRKYALRLCLESRKMEACVAIYSSMGLFEEAVVMALQVDLDMAIEQATIAKNHIDFIDRSREKQLWLRIANHVITVQKDIPRAMELLKHSILKIEDILPFFDDFKIIDPFQKHIQKSLETYNKEIQKLRESMEQSTVSAKAIRKDIQQLNKRKEHVTGGMQCAICEYPLLTRAFYIFPCSHPFHKDCLVREVIKFVRPSQRRRIADISEELKRLAPDAFQRHRVIELNAELDDIVGQDCMVCGEMAIDLIEEAFIPKAKLDEYIESWSTHAVDFGPPAEEEEFGIQDQPPVMDSFT